MKKIKQALKSSVAVSLDTAIKYGLFAGLLFFYLTSASLKYLVQ